MAFTLPSDLPTNLVDDSSTVDATFFNNLSTMGNTIKAALGTIGYSTKAAVVATGETTTSTSYTDLTTTTDQVTVPIGSSGMALVIVKADIAVTGSDGYVSYALSGDNTVAATDTKCLRLGYQYAASTGGLSAMFLETGLTGGYTTFKLKYKSGNAGNTQTFSNRRIAVIPFPSTDGTHASGAVNLNTSSSVAVGMSLIG